VDTLYAVGCLCAGEVSLLSFTEIFSPRKNHEIATSVEALALKGCIRYYDGVIYGYHCGKSMPIKKSLVEEMLGRLVEKTSISIFQYQREIRDYFIMGYSLIEYVQRNLPDIIDNTFALLLCRLVEHIDVWWPNNNYADRTEEIPIVRALSLTLTKIPSESPLASRLHAYTSLFFTNAFQYESAMFHIKKAEEIDKKHCADLQDYTYIAYGNYYWCFGLIAKSLECYSRCFTFSIDKHIKAFASAMIGLILALIG
jgi:tetratricopeptide (TPR) repeat protein